MSYASTVGSINDVSVADKETVKNTLFFTFNMNKNNNPVAFQLIFDSRIKSRTKQLPQLMKNLNLSVRWLISKLLT